MRTISPQAALLLLAIVGPSAEAGWKKRFPKELWLRFGEESVRPTPANQARYEAWCQERVEAGGLCELDAMQWPDLEALRTSLRAPGRGYHERLTATLSADRVVRVSVLEELSRDTDLHAVLEYRLSWSTRAYESTACAALVEPTTGQVLDSRCSHIISGRPAEPGVRRGVTPVTGSAVPWARMAAEEDEAVVAFTRHARELRGLGAPRELVLRAEQAIADERRHRELALLRASLHQGGPVRLLGPAHRLPPRTDLGTIAVDVAAGGAVNETVNTALLADEASIADAEEGVILLQIAADEAEHAGLAWDTLAWMWPQLSRAEREAVAEALAQRVTPRPLVNLDVHGARRTAGVAFEAIDVLREALVQG